jgi:hypothetical protein
MLSACRPVAQAQIVGENIEMPPGAGPAMCWGFFIGLQKVINLIPAQGQQPFLSVCAPEKSNRAQLIAIFVRYAEQNPQRHHEDVFWVAVDSLRAAFPCRTK